jgi:primosomal protein N' (replication factor Y)
LVAELETNLGRGEQSLLFLNRRGFAPLTLCRHCGHRFQCPNCTAWMVEHRLMHRLACHHCGHVMPPPRACPECGEEDSLVACGPGVERIADEVAALFPEARTAIVTSDTIWSPLRAAEFVGAMEAGAIDIVIGTQLVTKGYHFPNLTLVGVVDADLGLQGGDLRAAERSFQQVQQVSGRAGRADKPGRVFLQTHDPYAPVIAALVSGDTAGFYAAETEARREAAMPPFGRLAAIVVSAEDSSEAESVARRIGYAAPEVDGMAVFGPAPAPLAMLRGRHRQRLLVHAARSLDVQDVIRDWLAAVEWSAKVRVSVDVDPYSFL